MGLTPPRHTSLRTYPLSPPASPSKSPAHSSPSQQFSVGLGDEFELASRRRPGLSSLSLQTGEYVALPTHVSPTGSPPGSPRAVHRSRASCARPRTIASLLSVAIITLLLLPASNRRVAREAFGTVGVELPDHLISDRIQDFLEEWTFGVDDGSRDLAYVPPPSEALEDYSHAGVPAPVEQIVTPFTFHPNGHLLVDPLAAYPTPPTVHPILMLIQRAEGLWNHKVAKQSKTLAQAANEYRRRYTRNPPLGFDKWWAYAKANRIVLVDEYDQIHRDLEPFWALEPSDLLHRTTVMEAREETFTIQIANGKVGLHGEQAFLRRAKDLGDLMARFSSHVGDTNFTFTRHDQPACQLGWYHKEKMLELAKLGEYFGPSEFVEEHAVSLSNWANGCAPDSSLREVETAALTQPTTPGSGAKFKSHQPAYITDLSRSRSYIFDHSASMDICAHPEIMPIHGFTTTPGTNAGPLVPLFTFAKTNIHSDVLVTPLEQYSDTYIGYDPDFAKKRNNKLLWRGSTTGVNFDQYSDWRASQRSRLHFMTHEKGGQREVLVDEKEREGLEEMSVEVKAMNAAYMDVSFSGGPVQCDARTCNLMSKTIDFAPTMGLDESYQYKYVMDVDGNGWSGRFHRLMSMKALVLKSTLFPEWYSERVQPWVHYVPVKVDYTDLYDVMTFFRGTPDGKGAHEEIAAKIGLAGKRWARDHWRKQDMAGYMFRLSLEWSRLLHRGEGETQDYLL